MLTVGSVHIVDSPHSPGISLGCPPASLHACGSNPHALNMESHSPPDNPHCIFSNNGGMMMLTKKIIMKIASTIKTTNEFFRGTTVGIKFLLNSLLITLEGKSSNGIQRDG